MTPIYLKILFTWLGAGLLVLSLLCINITLSLHLTLPLPQAPQWTGRFKLQDLPFALRLLRFVQKQTHLRWLRWQLCPKPGTLLELKMKISLPIWLIILTSLRLAAYFLQRPRKLKAASN